MAYFGLTATKFVNIHGMALANFDNPRGTSNGEANINATLERFTNDILSYIQKNQSDRLSYVEFEKIVKDANADQTEATLGVATSDTDAVYVWVYSEDETIAEIPRKSDAHLVTTTVSAVDDITVTFATALSLGNIAYASYPANISDVALSLQPILIQLTNNELIKPRFPSNQYNKYEDDYDNAMLVLQQFLKGERVIEELKALNFMDDVDLSSPVSAGLYFYRENN